MSTESLDQLPPNLAPELVAVVRALAQQPSVDLRQTPDAACTILIRDETESLRCLALLGLKPLLAETERKLNQSQDALSRWELMKWDLLEGPGRSVCPCDYCPELSPEDVTFFRSSEFARLDSTNQCERIAHRLAETMGIEEALLFSDFHRKDVEMMVKHFTGMISELTRWRANLLRAIRVPWPGTTQADWDTFRS